MRVTSSTYCHTDAVYMLAVQSENVQWLFFAGDFNALTTTRFTVAVEVKFGK